MEITTTKRTPRIDLTPMVDLGFLLITFFLFTATISKPVALKLFLPNENVTDHERPQISSEKTLSLIIDEKGVWYYHGDDLHNLRTGGTTITQLRSVIDTHMKQVSQKFNSRNDAMILLKPTVRCSYKQLIDIIDEMTINDVKRFMLLEATDEEFKSINS